VSLFDISARIFPSRVVLWFGRLIAAVTVAGGFDTRWIVELFRHRRGKRSIHALFIALARGAR
jgi:hypothetical protein